MTNRNRMLAAGAAVSLIAVPVAQATLPQPEYKAGNPTCADIQGNQNWREFKIEDPKAGDTQFKNGVLQGSISVDPTRAYIGFKVKPGVPVVIVKGGPNANIYRFKPAAEAANDLHAPWNPNGSQEGKAPRPYGLSHITFCYTDTTPPSTGGGGGTPSTPTPPSTTPTPAPKPSGNPTPTTPKPGDPTPPKGGVLGEQVASGKAHMSGITGCAKTAFTARVRGREIKSVVFKIDGRKVKVVRSASAHAKKASVRVNPSRYGKGTHRLTARVTFNPESHTRAKTLALAFQRCASAAVAPKFAG